MEINPCLSRETISCFCISIRKCSTDKRDVSKIRFPDYSYQAGFFVCFQSGWHFSAQKKNNILSLFFIKSPLWSLNSNVHFIYIRFTFSLKFLLLILIMYWSQGTKLLIWASQKFYLRQSFNQCYCSLGGKFPPNDSARPALRSSHYVSQQKIIFPSAIPSRLSSLCENRVLLSKCKSKRMNNRSRNTKGLLGDL